MDKIQFELSPKPSKQEKLAQGKIGFVPVKARWIIERSNAWVEQCKSLVKNFERTLENANTKTVFYQTSDQTTRFFLKTSNRFYRM
jgi:hypothetical protein